MLEDSEADLEEKKRECEQLNKDLDYIQREHDKELADLRNQYDAEMARLMDEIDQLKVRPPPAIPNTMASLFPLLMFLRVLLPPSLS